MDPVTYHRVPEGAPGIHAWNQAKGSQVEGCKSEEWTNNNTQTQTPTPARGQYSRTIKRQGAVTLLKINILRSWGQLGEG